MCKSLFSSIDGRLNLSQNYKKKKKKKKKKKDKKKRILEHARTYGDIGGGTIFKVEGGTKLKWGPNFDHWVQFFSDWRHKTKGILNFDHGGTFSVRGRKTKGAISITGALFQ